MPGTACSKRRSPYMNDKGANIDHIFHDISTCRACTPFNVLLDHTSTSCVFLLHTRAVGSVFAPETIPSYGPVFAHYLQFRIQLMWFRASSCSGAVAIRPPPTVGSFTVIDAISREFRCRIGDRVLHRRFPRIVVAFLAHTCTPHSLPGKIYFANLNSGMVSRNPLSKPRCFSSLVPNCILHKRK